MKKIVYMAVLMAYMPLFGKALKKYSSCFDGAFCAGYVFKHDCSFKEVYGHGTINAITADGCYYPWERWGFGAKLSYWRKKGRTAFLQLHTLAQQVPFTVYLRRRKELDCGLQLYASLGVGGIWTKEKSYLGTVRFTKAIGELEGGVRYSMWHGVGLTGAVRYLFPPQKQDGQKVTVGGVDLRVGIGFSF